MSDSVLTDDKYSVLMAWTPKSMPDNPTARGWSASKIKEYQYKGFDILYGYLGDVETNLLTNKQDNVTAGYGLAFGETATTTLSFTGCDDTYVKIDESHNFYSTGTSYDSGACSVSNDGDDIDDTLNAIESAFACVDTDIKAEASARKQAITDEATARASADTTEANTRASAIATEQSVRASGDTTNATNITTNANNIKNIVNGTTRIGKSSYATNDDSGNEIVVSKYFASIETSYNATTGEITLAFKNQLGTTIATQVINTPMENLFKSVSYNETTKKLTFAFQTGSTSIDISDLIDTYTRADTDTITMSLNGKTFSAELNEGSVLAKHLGSWFTDVWNGYAQAEAERASAEDARVSAESARVLAENARIQAENGRVTTFNANENTRANTFSSNESSRASTFSNNESNRETTFDSLVSKFTGMGLLLAEVSDMDEDTGEITLTYNSELVTPTYSETTGILTLAY